ncbi:MAG: methyltransferase/methylesterase, CheR/CheB with sensor [Myxococcaceae bacterium]|nr:methyltransferase/methylesterase, CheR/CheB with sensor [Myxococcaceae bacterium]
MVGLGCSAGGLEALQTFFGHVPADTGLAFVVVTHQAPNRTSLLPVILAKATAMSVVEVADGMAVLPNHVYVAPPGRNLKLHRGALRLVEFEKNAARRLPVNFFFRSLAQDLGERSVGVVLSGTGTDGTLGLCEIKAALGLAMVQSETDATFPGMPHSAIYGDSPDIVLPVAELPARLLGYVRRVKATRSLPAPVAEAQASDSLQHVLALLRQRTGHDFSSYKQTTVRRRIERRMNVHRIDSLPQYVKFMVEDAAEPELLFNELLIGVTSFFRDPAAFESLGHAFTEYMHGKPDDYAVRVWVAGCSTGEEAYSIAILLRECMEQMQREIRVQIFATDLDPKAIERARGGLYPLAVAGDLDARRLKRFFGQTEHGFQVRKEVRDMLVFAPQNLIDDPPFTRLDLVSCRNLLIYLEPSLQKRLFPIFHYGLKPNGLLFLGSSETVGAFTNLFEPLDKKWRLSRRKDVADGTYLAEIPASVSLDVGSESAPLAVTARRNEALTLQSAERLLFRELVPPTVLMRERGDILHIHGRTGLFLEPAPGLQISSNIFDMAREGLHLELAAAVRQAVRQDGEVVRPDVRVQSNGHAIFVNLRVKKLDHPESARGLLRVSFELARSRDLEAREPGAELDAQPSARMAELERALQDTKESLQGSIEELETANEELKSTNEELQSTNEELQSSNEELETSKEELQSLNEELQTVNVELQTKVEELSCANDDMTNLLNATDIAIIFLDYELNIKRHNVQAKRVIRLIPSDVGRSIGDLVPRLRYGQLVDDAHEVLRTLVHKEVEVQGEADNRWYLMRILPYRTTDNVIDGLVVTFVDITRGKLLQQSEQQMMHALQHAPVTMFGLDAQLRLSWAWGPVFGVEASAVTGKTLGELYNDSYLPLQKLVARTVAEGVPLREKMMLTVRGRQVGFELYLEPLSAAGKVHGATCVAVELAHAV